MKASDYIADYLSHRGVDTVFEVVGGMITHLLDSIHRRGKIRVVSMHHEQGAAFAVDGMGRMRGRPLVAMATSGPGATNLITGIGSCYFDSVPAVFITGQVNRHELKRSSGVRQLGFQETDIVSMVRPITKAAWLIESEEALVSRLREAFQLATTGRPGPVLLDIPMDVQRLELPETFPVEDADVLTNEDSIPADLLNSLASAVRPLIIAGSGASQPANRDALRAVVESLNVPVVCSLLGNDFLESTHPLRVGFYGSYGNRWANHAVGRADWLLVIGSRLDIRQTGADTGSFAEGKRIFHVDVDPSEMNNRVKECHVIAMSLDQFAEAMTALTLPELRERSAWKEEIATNRATWPATLEYRASTGLNPCAVMETISREGKSASAYVADVGQHQMWAAQALHLYQGQRFLTSGGMGAMGYALPAAIGAAFACPGKPVVVVAGDGGFQLNLQELETVVRNRLPVKILLIDNRCHGMVRQFQQSYFHSRYYSTSWGYSAPNFSAVAKAYGLPAMDIETEEQMPEALSFFWGQPEQACMLVVRIAEEGNVYPKIAFGHPLTHMEPEVQPLEMEGT
jgi:acetolactate synthase-1/2/3 large subunit